MARFVFVNDSRGNKLNISRLETVGSTRTVYLTRDSGLPFVILYSQFNDIMRADGFTDAESNIYNLVLPPFVYTCDLCAIPAL